MGMPITVEVRDNQTAESDLDKIFDFFNSVDQKFSTYKEQSEISKINRGEIKEKDFSPEMKAIFGYAEETKQVSNGFFDILRPDGKIDPSGIVKGWAIFEAAKLLKKSGFKNFYVDAGGDVQVASPNTPWVVGIKNPFDQREIVKILEIKNEGVATSGTYIRGQHIYNPKNPATPLNEVVSITLIGPNVYEADRFATAAFAMGKEGINFVEKMPGFEAYQIDGDGNAVMTSGFEYFTKKYA